MCPPPGGHPRAGAGPKGRGDLLVSGDLYPSSRAVHLPQEINSLQTRGRFVLTHPRILLQAASREETIRAPEAALRGGRRFRSRAPELQGLARQHSPQRPHRLLHTRKRLEGPSAAERVTCCGAFAQLEDWSATARTEDVSRSGPAEARRRDRAPAKPDAGSRAA